VWEESEQRHAVASLTASSVPITAFTEEAGEAIVLGRAQADGLGQDGLGTEHLLDADPEIRNAVMSDTYPHTLRTQPVPFRATRATS
jgi:hypothetical protein